MRSTALLAASGTVVLALLFFGLDFALGRRLLFSHDMQFSDFWHLHYPLKHFYAEGLAEGRLAQWCHLLGTGVPLHAVGEAGMLYPPNLLLFSLLPLPLATNLSILGHFVLAGVLAALFARHLGASRGGALLAGLSFAFSAFFVGHARHMNLSAVAAWIPGLLLLLERYWSNRRSIDLAALSVVGALCLLAGHPQLAYNHALVAAGYALYLSLRAPPQGQVSATTWWGSRPRLRFAVAVLGAAMVALSLGAPQLLPSLELHRQGPRQGGLSYEYASEFDLHPAYLWTYLQPNRFGRPDRFSHDNKSADGSPTDVPQSGFRGVPGATNLYWEVVAYPGIVPLLLAACALFGGWRRREIRVLAVLALLSLFLALGRFVGIGALLHQVLPGYDLFRIHPRFLLYVNLALAVLAGLALSSLQARLRVRTAWLAFAAAAVAVLLTVGDLYLQLGSHNSTIDAAAWSEQPESLTVIAAAENSVAQRSRLLSFDPEQKVFLRGYLSSQGWSAGHERYEPARNLARDNYNLLFDVPQVEFYLPLYPQRARALTESLYLTNRKTGRADQLHRPLAALFNVGYVLASERGAPSGLPQVRRFPAADKAAVEPILLHRVPGVLPRAFLVGSARIASGAAASADFLPAEQMEALLAVTGRDFNPLRQLVIDRRAGEESPPTGLVAEPVTGTVKVLRHEAERMELAVSADRDCWLFVSDTWYPGWQATLDGQPTPIFPANVAGRAVRIPAGEHSVVFHFRSGSLRMGAALALLALLALAVFVVRFPSREP